MSSRLEFVEYICGQAAGAGNITFKRMFGEFGLYCNGLLFGLVCDDQLFIKSTEAVCAAHPALPKAAPYPGSKPYLLIESPDDREALSALVRATCDALPPPKPKALKKPKA